MKNKLWKFAENISRKDKKRRSKTKLRAVKNLPEMFFFTDRLRIKNIFNLIEELPKQTAIIIREYDLSFADRLHFIRKTIIIARKKKLKVLVGKSWKMAKMCGADGVHFSDWDKNFLLPKNLGKMIFSYSSHHSNSLKKAKRLGCDLVFHSPIFASQSHPKTTPVGIGSLKNFTKKNLLPTYALGGVNEGNIKMLIDLGIGGFGGISIFENLLPN